MRKALILTVAAVITVMAMGGASAGAQPVFVEDFEDGDVAGWGRSGPSNGTFEAVTTPVSPSGGSYVGKHTFAGSCYGWGTKLNDPVAPDYISYYFRADGDTGHPRGVGIYFQDATGWMTLLSYHQGALRYTSPGWGYNQITPASMGTWYLIELRNIDWDSDTFDIWVDGVEKVVGAAFVAPVDSVQWIYSHACPWASGPTYVDDITFGFYDEDPPIVTDVAASLNPAAVAQPLTLSATVDDSPAGNSMIAAAEYALDGGPYSPMSASDGAFDEPTEAVEATLGSFDTPDVHTLCVRGTDAAGNTSTEECTFLVIYDPSAGFVTGGGWIDSPAGAYHPSDLPFFDGSYYEIVFSDVLLSWFEARDTAAGLTCGSCMGGHLATITSQEEYDTILELFDEWPGALLGGFQEEGVYPPDEGWEWVTGEPFDFAPWLPGEPNDCAPQTDPTDPDCPEASEQILEMYPEGWNDVPVGEPRNLFMVEYEDCYLPTGRATFGFVSKYKKGADVPTGNTEFQFHAADLNFHSTSYDWLVVTGSDYAKFKGVGTINGVGEYKFKLWAGDDDPDTFRIKIWTEDEFGVETVVYDNGMDQAIGGGSIVIHTKKK